MHPPHMAPRLHHCFRLPHAETGLGGLPGRLSVPGAGRAVGGRERVGVGEGLEGEEEALDEDVGE
jgi:hypothetical protein